MQLEGAWLGAFVFVGANIYLRDIPLVGRLGGGSGRLLAAERFNTVIGVLLLVIVVVSPDGLAGIIVEPATPRSEPGITRRSTPTIHRRRWPRDREILANHRDGPTDDEFDDLTPTPNRGDHPMKSTRTRRGQISEPSSLALVAAACGDDDDVRQGTRRTEADRW